ncbi:LacI family transcriptional regulator [Nocardioides rotundus]|uniref:LacI family DNA-binding transcriptional regulator n=1 Tax=Nocardioides rotundus TaxID=1774216 RepID=UPI001CC15173|nr:LacI family DNA-binding transcriptional regulator [Nocardioides rotundus]UAL28977.1 LacI family transcriptional regulator [Nocardioides rotundus]
MTRARLQDVADRAGVSTATVSLVLRGRPGPSEPTRQRVRAAAEELGYRADRAASLLARRRSRLVGVVLDVTSPYHGELAAGLDEEAAERGLELVLVTTTARRSEAEALETVRDSRCEAVVLLGPCLPAERLAELDAACPVVALGRDLGAAGDSVLVDDRALMELAVAHLAERGHRRLAHVDGGRGQISAARRRAFRAAVRARPSLGGEVLAGGTTEEAGMAAGAELSARSAAERPTAVVAFNDRAALGIREAALRAGVAVPEDLALVGIDDSPLARLATVSLTSVGQDPAGQAAVALGLVEQRLAGAPSTGARRLEPRLRVRGTT